MKDIGEGEFVYFVEAQKDLSTMNYTSTLNIDKYCIKHNLIITKLLPPYTTYSEEHFNECIYYWQPGMNEEKGFDCCPTDGEGRPIIPQQDSVPPLTIKE